LHLDHLLAVATLHEFHQPDVEIAKAGI